jgi:hypothetical protein
LTAANESVRSAVERLRSEREQTEEPDVIRNPSIQVLVDTITGRTATFHINPSSHIRDLKALIQQRIGTPPDAYCIVFNGRVLEDDEPPRRYPFPGGDLIWSRSRVRVSKDWWLLIRRPRADLVQESREEETICVYFQINCSH